MSAFHNRRDLLLQSFRITCQQTLNHELDEVVQSAFANIVMQVLDVASGIHGNGHAFTRKCIDSLTALERFQARIADALQSRAILGDPRGPEFYATFEFQKESLFKQHEALASTLAYLFDGNYASPEELRKLNEIVKQWPRLDFNLIHYLPAFASAFRTLGSLDGTNQTEAESLNRALGDMPKDPSPIRPFRAALVLWWTAEYSGRFRDLADDPTNEQRGIVVKAALKDDALECLLSMCTAVNSDSWRHPARHELVALLLSDGSGISLDGDQTSTYFALHLMESLESFVEAFITNMPDSIRRLKAEEDDQRLNQLVAIQEGLPIDPRHATGSRLHLEAFLVLISFAFQQRPEAAAQWWEDPDNNLYGFLQWASMRQTVPRVSAFCEVLCSISEDQECAEAAHKFLLDVSLPTTSRGRRNPSMNYAQIFAELQLYATKVHERTTSSQLPSNPKVAPTEMNELESPVMLSGYLRLLAHLCRLQSGTRQYILENVSVSFPQSLLILSSGPIPNYMRASIFATLAALLTDKTLQVASDMWRTLDDWGARGHDSFRASGNQSASPHKASLAFLNGTLGSIALSFDQYDAFVVLLRDLIAPLPSTSVGADHLPFPADLGASYRSIGIEPYVDFVCGHIISRRLPELSDDTQRSIGSFHCLDFIAVGLEGFNEDHLAMLDRSVTLGVGSQDTQGPTFYAQTTPFARLVQWILSADVLKFIMSLFRVSVDAVEGALPDSPLLMGLQRSIDIVNRVLDLQPTYFDIVKPLLQSRQATDRQIRASIGSLEDAFISNADVLLGLCQFAASSHADLSLRSLALLQKLSSSTKINGYPSPTEATHARPRRLVDAFGSYPAFELELVAQNLSERLQVTFRELEDGFGSLGYLTKDGILAFFNACLGTQPNVPNLAHLLLGFDRIGEALFISDNINEGTAVLNAITSLAQEYPVDDGVSLTFWLLHLKTAAFSVLRHLWTSPLSSVVVIGQLRRIHFLQAQYVSMPIISQTTLWDGFSVLQKDKFWYATSAEALAKYLDFRAALFNYTETELRAAASEQLSTTLRQALSTLQGRTTDTDGSIINHADIFSFFDFLDLDLSASFDIVTKFWGDVDFDTFLTDPGDELPSLYNLGLCREWLNASKVDLLQRSTETSSNRQAEIELDIIEESDGIIATLEARNRAVIVRKARADALHEYMKLIVAIIETCPLDTPAKSQFVLHMLQIMLPKLDAYITDNLGDVAELARAADALLFSLSETSAKEMQPHLDNLVTDKLFQLFRASIEGISASESNTQLRSTFYSICAQYLSRILVPQASGTTVNSRARRNAMDCVRSSSQRLVQLLCDDADEGVDACRINAFNLLALLTSLARLEKSSFILNAIVKANALEILIDPIKYISKDFEEADSSRECTLLCRAAG